MTLRTTIRCCFLAALLFGAVPDASAQEITSPYRFIEHSQSIRLYGGYLITDPGELGLGPESGPIGGLRYSIRISGPFVVEAGVGFFPSSRTVLDTVVVGDSVVADPVGTADLSILLLDAALRFNITGPRTFHGFVPYALAGGGLAIGVSGSSGFAEQPDSVPGDGGPGTISPGATFDFGTTFAGQVGVGVEWFVTRQITIGIDARDVLWQIPTPPAFRGRESRVPDEEWVQNFLLSAVVTYRF